VCKWLNPNILKLCQGLRIKRGTEKAIANSNKVKNVLFEKKFKKAKIWGVIDLPPLC
jgi:hypothetical protein